MRTALPYVATVLLFIVLPVGGAIGGGWAAITFAAPEPMETPERACGLAVIPQFLNDVVATGLVGLAGAGIGLAGGVLIALRTAGALSEWSANKPLDEDDEV